MASVRNLDYYLNRLNGYSKNTIRVQPVSKQSFNANETIILRLPTNAIVDLHTLCLSLDAFTWCTASGAGVPGVFTPSGGSQTQLVSACLPRYVQSMFRRVDVTAGGVQVGLGSLSDYGGVWNLLALNTLGTDKHNELAKYELAGPLPDTRDLSSFAQSGQEQWTNTPAASSTGGNLPIAVPSYTPPGAQPTSGVGTLANFNAQRVQCSNWLGVLGGGFMRFLDTNLLPDVEIRITLNNPNVLTVDNPLTYTTGTPATSTISFTNPQYMLQNVYLAMETISFGDDSYRRMLDARLASGDPIIVPFTNWASFETSSGSGARNSNTQFTVATQSLDAVYGTARLTNYDSVPTVAGFGTGAPSTDNEGQIITTGVGDTQLSRMKTANMANAHAASFYQFKSLDVASSTGTSGAGRIQQYGKYQFAIDAKVYPQFLADSNDCYFLTRNSFDGGAVNRAFESSIINKPDNVTDAGSGTTATAYLNANGNVDWQENAFALGVSLNHNGDANHTDRMISGLNTNGSNIPISWMITNVPTSGPLASGWRPIVFCEMTSTLMIYSGRVISVIN